MSSDQLLTLIVAFLGIGGTAVSAYLSAQLNRKADAERADRDREAKREELLFDARRERFADYLQAVERAREHFITFVRVKPGTNIDALRESMRDAANKLFVLETELRLIAPGLKDHCSLIRRSTSTLRRLDVNEDKDIQEALLLQMQLESSRDLVLKGMRTMLGISH